MRRRNEELTAKLELLATPTTPMRGDAHDGVGATGEAAGGHDPFRTPPHSTGATPQERELTTALEAAQRRAAIAEAAEAAAARQISQLTALLGQSPALPTPPPTPGVQAEGAVLGDGHGRALAAAAARPIRRSSALEATRAIQERMHAVRTRRLLLMQHQLVERELAASSGAHTGAALVTALSPLPDAALDAQLALCEALAESEALVDAQAWRIDELSMQSAELAELLRSASELAEQLARCVKRLDRSKRRLESPSGAPEHARSPFSAHRPIPSHSQARRRARGARGHPRGRGRRRYGRRRGGAEPHDHVACRGADTEPALRRSSRTAQRGRGSRPVAAEALLNRRDASLCLPLPCLFVPHCLLGVHLFGVSASIPLPPLPHSASPPLCPASPAPVTPALRRLRSACPAASTDELRSKLSAAGGNAADAYRTAARLWTAAASSPALFSVAAFSSAARSSRGASGSCDGGGGGGGGSGDTAVLPPLRLAELLDGAASASTPPSGAVSGAMWGRTRPASLHAPHSADADDYDDDDDVAELSAAEEIVAVAAEARALQSLSSRFSAATLASVAALSPRMSTRGSALSPGTRGGGGGFPPSLPTTARPAPTVQTSLSASATPTSAPASTPGLSGGQRHLMPGVSKGVVPGVGSPQFIPPEADRWSKPHPSYAAAPGLEAEHEPDDEMIMRI